MFNVYIMIIRSSTQKKQQQSNLNFQPSLADITKDLDSSLTYIGTLVGVSNVGAYLEVRPMKPQLKGTRNLQKRIIFLIFLIYFVVKKCCL